MERTEDLHRQGVTVLCKPFDIDELLAMVADRCGVPHDAASRLPAP